MRAELHLSQREAASRCGISFGEWQSMENGADARALDRKIACIVEAFDVDRDWLMWGGRLDQDTPGRRPPPGLRMALTGWLP